MSQLTELLHRPDADIDAIAGLLESLDPDAREQALSALSRADQRALYEKAATSPPVSLRDFVPESVAPLAPIHHFGRNTLPLPRKHRFFEKRFCRASDGTARLFGYNHSPSRGWIGPGYFVAYDTRDHAGWPDRGQVVIDYFKVPDGPVSDGWPEVVPNTQKLQRFVYNGTRDFMRRVSDHVTIGTAFKGEKALDHYFVLCRRDPS